MKPPTTPFECSSNAKTVQEVVPIVQTGDLHITIYGLTNMIMYVANAKSDSETGPAMVCVIDNLFN
jgi:hypothetical protein